MAGNYYPFDVLVFHAIGLASRNGPASLPEVFAASNKIGHSNLADAELDHALNILVAKDFIVQHGELLTLTSRGRERFAAAHPLTANLADCNTRLRQLFAVQSAPSEQRSPVSPPYTGFTHAAYASARSQQPAGHSHAHDTIFSLPAASGWPDTVIRTFAFLESEYGFHREQITDANSTTYVRYSKNRSALLITYEWRDGYRIALQEIGDDGVLVEHALEKLVAQQAPWIRSTKGRPRLYHSTHKLYLPQSVEFLRAYATEVLHGGPSPLRDIFAPPAKGKLKRKIAANLTAQRATRPESCPCLQTNTGNDNTVSINLLMWVNTYSDGMIFMFMGVLPLLGRGLATAPLLPLLWAALFLTIGTLVMLEKKHILLVEPAARLVRINRENRFFPWQPESYSFADIAAVGVRRQIRFYGPYYVTADFLICLIMTDKREVETFLHITLPWCKHPSGKLIAKGRRLATLIGRPFQPELIEWETRQDSSFFRSVKKQPPSIRHTKRQPLRSARCRQIWKSLCAFAIIPIAKCRLNAGRRHHVSDSDWPDATIHSESGTYADERRLFYR